MGNKIEEQVLFTKKECEYIKSLWNEDDFKPSTITKNGIKNISSESRTSDGLFISSNLDTENLLINKLKTLGIKSLPTELNVLRYNTNNEFKLHTDTGSTYSERYKTVVIQLSEESEYSGGELNIFDRGTKYTASRKLGNVILFDSQLEHKAEKVLKGIRYVMVFWLEKSHFGFSNSLI